MYVNYSILHRGRDPASLFAFFHSQRTGGSEFVRWLNTVIAPEQIMHVRNVGSDRMLLWDRLDADALSGFRLWAGFGYFTPLDLDRPVIPISNVRHPFYRNVSLYRMSSSHPSHMLHELAAASSFEEFYRKGSKERPHYFNEMLCRRLSGNRRAPTADHALECIRGHFAIVGETNRLVDTMQILAHEYGWPAPKGETAREITPDEIAYAEYRGSSVFDEIMSRNVEDFRLYEAIRTESDEVEYPIDVAYAAAREAEPDLTLAAFYTRRVAAKVGSGHTHNSLGGDLRTRDGERQDFWSAGETQAQRWIRRFRVSSTERVVDYGCGTLRVGGHFIRHLDPDSYFGLDVIPQFLEQGRQLIGEDLLQEKRPRLTVISEASIAEAAAFEPGLVISHAVMNHVHPDEVDRYIDNLKRIAGRPGARIVLNTSVTAQPSRYNQLGWGLPAHDIVSRFAPMEVAVQSVGKPRKINGIEVCGGLFAFRRPESSARA